MTHVKCQSCAHQSHEGRAGEQRNSSTHA